jgi:hypothetical protein
MRAALLLVLATLVAWPMIAKAEEEDRLRPGDLVVVRARLRGCPDRLRLLEVLRLGEARARILDLGEFDLVGRTTGEVLRDVREAYRRALPNATIPPIQIQAWDRDASDVKWEVWLLQLVLLEGVCQDHVPPVLESLYRLIAAR